MNKKCLGLVLAVFLSFLCVPSYATSNSSDLSVSAKACVLIDASTGKVLFEKNSNNILQMASTTKIMTTLLSIESGNLDEYFEVDSNAIKVEGSSMGLVEGDKVTKRILCYGMMLPSGNDAANATAVRVAGSIEKFAEMMNNRAKKIGMTNTHFVTPSGLDDNTDLHYSTAYDMALLTQEALRNPIFREICSTTKVKLEYGNPPYTRWLQNTNKLLKSYEGIIGVKTGFTDKAKRCLVSACERNGVTLICVTLNASNDWNDHMKLYNYGFSVVKKVEIPADLMDMYTSVVGGKRELAYIKQQSAPTTVLYGSNDLKVKKVIILPPFLYAPLKKGDIVGRADYIVDNKVVESIPLVVNEDVDELYVKTGFSFKKFIENVF